MKTNVLLVLEISIILLFIFFLSESFLLHFEEDISSFKIEDIYASLISVNYLNITDINKLSNIICKIVSNIIAEYEVYINDTLVCKNGNNFINSIKTFYIINGEIFYVKIKIK